MFWAGGDSLLVGPQSAGSDSVFQVHVTSIDGTVRDSIQVAGPGLGLQALSVSPDGRWIVALGYRAPGVCGRCSTGAVPWPTGW